MYIWGVHAHFFIHGIIKSESQSECSREHCKLQDAELVTNALWDEIRLSVK